MTPVTPKKLKFTDFFEKIVVQLDKNVFTSENEEIEWINAPGLASCDRLEISRPCTADSVCFIKFYLKDFPARVKLKSPVSSQLGLLPSEPKEKIITRIWHHIKVIIIIALES